MEHAFYVKEQKDIRMFEPKSYLKSKKKTNARSRLGQYFSVVLFILATSFQVNASIFLDKRLSENSTGMVLIEVASRQQTITGKVVNAANEPIVGVSVTEKSTKNSTATDERGDFTLKLNTSEAILVFSAIGYQTQEAQSGSSPLNIILAEDLGNLEEVVVVGYGAQKRTNVTGAVSSVDLATIAETRPITNVASGLTGLVPGLYVRSATNDPGSDATMLLRGQGTLNNSAPLVIIDGVEGNLSRISPMDIASISVLKDAASAAIYGSRAANGVVLITTKQGAAGRMSFTYDAYYAAQNVGRLIPLVDNSVEYMELVNEAARNSNVAQVFSDDNIQLWRNNQGGDPLLWPNSNWGESLFRTAHTANHNISASGGTEKITSFLSFNYSGVPGIVENTGFDRYNVRANTNLQLTDWLKLGANLNGVLTDKERGSDRLSDMFTNSILAVPTVVDRHPDGRFGGTQNIEDNQVARSPVWYLNALNGINKTQAITSRFYANLSPFQGLTINSSFAFDVSSQRINTTPTQNDTWNFQTNTVQSPGTVQLNVTNQHRRTQRNFMDIFINYEHNFFEKLYTKLMLGASQEQYENQLITVTRQDLIHEDLTQINAATGAATANGLLEGDWAMQSLFSRLNLAWDDRYLLEVNFRRDGSSRFSPSNRWGNFPSVSAGWRINQESFFDISAINELKLRGSYGGLGNNAIADYAAIPSLSPLLYTFNNMPFTGFGVTAIPNINVQWETTYVANIGLDFSLLNNRLSGALDFYNKDTRNILIALPAPLVRGTASVPPVNSARVNNKGLEAQVNWQHAVNAFNYFLGVNLTFNRNLVTRFRGDDYTLSGTQMIKEGLPINTHYVMTVDRIVETETDLAYIQQLRDNAPFDPANPTQRLNPFPYGVPQLGDFLYKDLNGDGLINDQDRQNVGQGPNPRFFYSFNVGGSYKGFDASVFFDGVSGRFTHFFNDYYNPILRQTRIINREIADGRWYEGRTSPATFPRLLINDNRNTQPSDFYVQEMSFLRIRNIQLGYTFPESIQNKLRTSRLRIYTTLENFFTFTNYSGLDPEVEGIQYPVMKQVVFGVNLSF